MTDFEIATFKSNECPTLQKNLTSALELTHSFMSSSEANTVIELDFETLGSVFDNYDGCFLGIYDTLNQEFFDKHFIKLTAMDNVQTRLDAYAYTYLTAMSGLHLKSIFNEADDYFERLDRAIKRMELLLVPEVEKIYGVLKIFSFNDELPKRYDAIIKECLERLTKMKALRTDFKNTPLVTELSFTKQYSVKNPGLQKWMENMLYLWTKILGRSLENKADGINGRKQLLEFAMDCMELVHPALEYHTLDNMLRKIQNAQSKTVKDQA